VSTGVRILRGVFALFALIAIVVGIPITLWLMGNPLLPDHVPGLDEAAAALRSPTDGRFVLGFLVVCGWLFWLHLAVSTAAEVADHVRAGTRRRLDRRGFRTSRVVTGMLIVWLVAMFASPAASSASVPAAVPVSASFDPTPSAAHFASLDADPPGPVGPDYTVVPRDSLWGIAEKTLGDPLRWRQIFDLNAGRVQSDGGRLDDRSLLHVGWILRLPPEAATPVLGGQQVRVQSGDTLSGLATTYLHDANQYPKLYQANAGRPQADGRSLQDPDLIRPGWVFALPSDADATGHATDPGVHDQPAPPSPVRPVPPPVVTTPAPSSRSPATAAVPAAPSSSSPTHAPTTPTTPTAANPARPPAPAPANSTDAAILPVAITISGVVAAAFVSGLALLRRRQLRFRRTGRHIALPDHAHYPIETTAVASARTDDTRILDLALRSVAALCDPLDDYPDLAAAWLAGDQVDLVLACPYPPRSPFTVGDDESRWHISAEAELPVHDDEPAAMANPFPAVAAFGTGDDGSATLLLDLEHHGAIHVVGDRHRAQDLLRNVAVELALSRWADATQILLVGLEPQLAELPPGRIGHVPDVATAVARLRAAAAETREHLDRLSTDSILDARVHDQYSETWIVTVLIVADPAADDEALLADLCRELSTAGRTSTAILTGGASFTLPGLLVHVRPDGSTHIPDVTDTQLQAVQIAAELALGLVSVIGTTFEPDVPVPTATDPSPWAIEMTIDGALSRDHASVPDHEDDRPDADLEPPDAPPVVLPEPRRDGDFTATADQRAAGPAANPGPERTLLRAELNDPDLDADLDRWRSAEPPSRPLIAILGEPEMRAPGVRPNRRVPWLLEVALYLALHPQGVDRDKISTDLWPEGRNIQPPTIRRAIAEVRAWAGQDISTDPPTDFVPPISSSGTDRYRMFGQLCDWDLFRRLRKRAQARHAAGHHTEAITDYQAALSLVRGPVLRPIRERGYAWLRNPDQHHDSIVPAFIIDAAHELVDLALERDDLPLARSAAETARLVDPDLTFDRPFTDLMRVAHAEGNLAEMREHADLLLAERDFEVGEDLPPESFAVFNALFPHGLRTPAS